jgi:hypothetical protein
MIVRKKKKKNYTVFVILTSIPRNSIRYTICFTIWGFDSKTYGVLTPIPCVSFFYFFSFERVFDSWKDEDTYSFGRGDALTGRPASRGFEHN